MIHPIRLSRRTLLGKMAQTGLSLAAPTAWAAAPPVGPARHGVALLGQLAYAEGFRSFGYVSPEAPKGGALRLARLGSFDTIDTLRYPGRPPGDIRLIYERLFVLSDDEVASYYGLLAETIAVAEDFSRLTITLRTDARWHDGRPIDAGDVVFTFETLKAVGAPFYRQAYRMLTIEADDGNRVTFLNQSRGDRDMVRRIAAIPIHPAHVWRDGSTDPRPEALVGSGPYRLASVDAPRRLVLERVADAWATDHPVNRGRWNFDRLVFDYYRDADVALQAFLADAVDLRVEDSPARWSGGYDVPAVASGAVRRAATRSDGGGTVRGIVVNARRGALADRRVRLALRLAYDPAAIHASLFGGVFRPAEPVFGAHDAADPVASPARADPWAPGSRAALAEAGRLLEEAGYPIRDGRRIDGADGTPLVFRLVSSDPLYDRPVTWLVDAWRRLGIEIARDRTEPASAMRRLLDRDFDLAPLSWTVARLPGTSERLLWHSALADRPHSYALSGVKESALDAAIEALATARTQAALVAAGDRFDRAFGTAVVFLPLWREDTVRLAWWDRFGHPATEMDRMPPSPIDRWWAKAPASEDLG